MSDTLINAIKTAAARYNVMTPEEREKHDREQRESIIRGLRSFREGSIDHDCHRN